MTSEQGKSEQTAKLWELIDGIKIAMLTTRDGDVLRSRPMELIQTERDGTLWFFTYASSHKTSEVESENAVNLSFADKKNQNYVSISGIAAVVRNRAKAQDLWTEELRTWFPRGLDDPELALLRVSVRQAEYWDRPSAAMVAEQSLVKVVTDETPNLEQNEKLNFEHAR